MAAKTVIIGLLKAPNTDYLSFHLKEETKKHVELGKILYKIEGITQSPGEKFPLCMDHEGQYDFGLVKGSLFSWKELLPVIKREIRNYFKKQNRPVRFIDMKGKSR